MTTPHQPPSTEELEEWKLLRSRATPGTWKRDPFYDPRCQIIAVGNVVVAFHNFHGRQIDSQVVPNFEYIEAAANALPRLIAEVERLKAIVESNSLFSTVDRLTAENEELRKDKERLDWLEKEKPILNRLSVRDKANSDYWHLCWGDWARTQHFGGEETIQFTVRQSIDAAIQKGQHE